MTLARPLAGNTISSAVDLVNQYIAYVTPLVAANTAKNRKHILLPMFRNLGIPDITQITVFDIELYLAERSKRLKPTSISLERQVLRSFFQYCEEYREINLAFHWDVIKRRKVKAPRKEVFDREEIERVINSCKHRQDRLMVALFFYTGIRIDELRNTRIEHIRGTQIRIRGKGSNDRVVHMPLWLAQEIRQYTALRASSGGYLFRPLQKHNNHPSTHYTSNYAIRGRVQREFMEILGKKMHPHQLRHSFSVDWLMRGGDLRTLQIILGHDSIETTQVYLGLTDIQTGDIYARVFAGQS